MREGTTELTFLLELVIVMNKSAKIKNIISLFGLLALVAVPVRHSQARSHDPVSKVENRTERVQLSPYGGGPFTIKGVSLGGSYPDLARVLGAQPTFTDRNVQRRDHSIHRPFRGYGPEGRSPLVHIWRDIDQVEGQQVEEDGKVVLQEEMSRDQVHEVLGTPQASRTDRDIYTGHHLGVLYHRGRVKSFWLDSDFPKDEELEANLDFVLAPSEMSGVLYPFVP